MRRRNETWVDAVRRPAAEWRTLVAEWERSGLDGARFAASRGVRPATLSWWKYEFRRRDGRSSATPTVAQRFVELVPQRGPSETVTAGLEAVLTSGVVLRAAADVDVEAFARCVAALERAC